MKTMNILLRDFVLLLVGMLSFGRVQAMDELLCAWYYTDQFHAWNDKVDLAIFVVTFDKDVFIDGQSISSLSTFQPEHDGEKIPFEMIALNDTSELVCDCSNCTVDAPYDIYCNETTCTYPTTIGQNLTYLPPGAIAFPIAITRIPTSNKGGGIRVNNTYGLLKVLTVVDERTGDVVHVVPENLDPSKCRIRFLSGLSLQSNGSQSLDGSITSYFSPGNATCNYTESGSDTDIDDVANFEDSGSGSNAASSSSSTSDTTTVVGIVCGVFGGILVLVTIALCISVRSGTGVAGKGSQRYIGTTKSNEQLPERTYISASAHKDHDRKHKKDKKDKKDKKNKKEKHESTEDTQWDTELSE